MRARNPIRIKLIFSALLASLCHIDDPILAQTIDVLAVYTAEARTAAGGQSGIISRIDAAISQANLSLSTSQAQAVLRLVHLAEIAYAETGNLQTELERLKGTTDGHMDSAHTLRDQYGADVVTLFTGRTDTGGYSGMGYVMNTNSSIFANWAFSVTRQDYATQFTFVHEVGHNLGCNHDPDSATSSAAYAYSYGHRFWANSVQYRTIMAYAPGTRIGYFSNPSVNFNSVATGIADQRDNARTIRNTAATVAAFRDTVYGDINLRATALDNRVSLRWAQPTTIGFESDLAHLRFSTNTYPATTNDGTLVYQGTNQAMLHTNTPPYITHYYSIWGSNDGTTLIAPP